MTETALCFGLDMSIIHACGSGSIVAAAAHANVYIAVIKTAIRLQFDKRVCVVAFIALLGGIDMEIGFTYGQPPVMTIATRTKNFLVIDKGNDGKSHHGMTGLTAVAGWRMGRGFNRFGAEASHVALRTVGRKGRIMIERPCGFAVTRLSGYHIGDNPIAGNTFRTDNKLYSV